MTKSDACPTGTATVADTVLMEEVVLGIIYSDGISPQYMDIGPKVMASVKPENKRVFSFDASTPRNCDHLNEYSLSVPSNVQPRSEVCTSIVTGSVSPQFLTYPS